MNENKITINLNKISLCKQEPKNYVVSEINLKYKK